MTVLHRHHIIPKHMGGTDDSSNIEYVTVEEHAKRHQTLYEKHGNYKDWLAWQGLLGLIGKEEIVSEISRKNAYNMGKANKGRTPWNKGKKTGPKSEEYKQKLSKIRKGKKKPEGFGEKVSKALKNKPKSEQHKKNLAAAGRGKHWYNNGKIARQYLPHEVPEGFQRGRKINGI